MSLAESGPTTYRFDRYCRATAEIVYRLPDHPHVLQTFVWQHCDIAPDYPVLRRFLAYWEAHLDGAIHSVRVARTRPTDRRALTVARHLAHLH